MYHTNRCGVMGDRESGMTVVGDCRVDLVELGGGDEIRIVWLGGVGYMVMWCPWIRGGGGVSR